MTTISEVKRQSQFPLGQVYATSEAKCAVPAGVIVEALGRHAQCDWGDVCEHDRAENESALRDGRRLFSVYHAGNGVTLWIVTEANRSATTVHLPSDY